MIVLVHVDHYCVIVVNALYYKDSDDNDDDDGGNGDDDNHDYIHSGSSTLIFLLATICPCSYFILQKT